MFWFDLITIIILMSEEGHSKSGVYTVKRMRIHMLLKNLMSKPI